MLIDIARSFLVVDQAVPIADGEFKTQARGLACIEYVTVRER